METVSLILLEITMASSVLISFVLLFPIGKMLVDMKRDFND